MYFAHIKNNQIITVSECKYLDEGVLNIEISKQIYENWEDYIYFNGEIIINPELDKIKLENAKNTKIQENDTARDEALVRGVTYNNILFDSDTDQKVNLLAMVSSMSDESSVEWFGMNNDSMTCTKQDLLNIGVLITTLHSYCWNKNAIIKNAINDAKTVEEVENIKIDYGENE